ncbi:MAG: hypothetical protein HXS43_09860, partial [Theionarchaea archaeon]|nr:hypothetical protein [Theionarchaea archaeon]
MNTRKIFRLDSGKVGEKEKGNKREVDLSLSEHFYRTKEQQYSQEDCSKAASAVINSHSYC